MSRQELSYFDIMPQWQASNHTTTGSQQGTGVSESADSTGVMKATDEYGSDSDCDNGTAVIEKNRTVPTKRRQAFEDKRITQDEINKLESRLKRTTILCTSLFCINIAISGAMFLNSIRKQ
ncbi:hypothetical protein FAGAP_2941 [Fusarium agapanthi]|uniref:Uncharacterized protein n=1 Tax=Fusarium agapanthi TaxID=1803897 RepID=A0A9P5BEN8_9HYPO|nr:hypothetical protein FAGAP_2941 [Fusarium agapanthi]